MEEPTFINNFWDSQFQGVQVVNQKVNDSLDTLVDLLNYYNTRIAIEKDYCKRLGKLNGSAFSFNEIGTLKLGLDRLDRGNDEIIENNTKFIRNLETINYEGLKTFYNTYKAKSSKIMNHINKLHSKKVQLASQLNQCKESYQQSCGALKQNHLLTQTTWGKELERHQSKAAKLSSEATKYRKEYQISLAAYKEINDIFTRDWAIALKDIYQLEIEKVQSIKVNCFHFCNNIATLCVDNDKSSDAIRTWFAKINPPQDLQAFALTYGTGNKIYKSPEYLEFMDGVDESNHTDEFTLANFQLPDSTSILTRNYSYKDAVESNAKKIQKDAISIPKTPSQPHPHSANIAEKPLPSVSYSQPTIKVARKVPEDIRSTDSHETDVFDESKKFGNSTSSSKYSDDTNYTSSSAGRHWNSPRRGEKELNIVQDKINRQTKELPIIRQTEIPNLEPKVDIKKDFSVDFIAKALEDLNSGGDGDVSLFRRSVRRQREQNQRQSDATVQIHDNIQDSFSHNKLPTSDFVNDSNEVATRYYSRPQSMIIESLQPVESKKTESRRKSMIDLAFSSFVKHKRTISKSPTKSYTDLNSIMMNSRITPISKHNYVGKAKARYTYKPQHEGELYMKKGWNMYIINRQEDNWYVCELAANCGDCEGLVGLVPGNYLVEGEDVF